jgi:hypothetical protein
MNSNSAKVEDVRIRGGMLSVSLDDGRVLSLPLAWYPSLQEASASERALWRKSAAGFGIHWPALDYDLSVEGLLRGAKEARSVLALTRRFRTQKRSLSARQRPAQCVGERPGP